MKSTAKKTAGKKTAKKTSDDANSTSGSKNSSSGAAKSTVSKKNTEENEGGDFHDMFVDMLDDIYWAEKHLVKKLPAAGRAATSEKLYNAVKQHYEVTKNQVERLEKVFESIGEKAEAKKCDAMEGLVKEVESMIEDTEDGSLTRDAGLIVSLQKVEHYEIAAYGGLYTLAGVLGYTEAASLLKETQDEEKEADESLTMIAESSINEPASQE